LADAPFGKNATDEQKLLAKAIADISFVAFVQTKWARL
jgi:hypothetical protein